MGRVCVDGCSDRVSKKLLSQHSCFSLQQIFRIFSFAFFDFAFEVFFVVSSFVLADVVFGAVVTSFVDWFRTFGLVVLIRLVSGDGLTVGFNPFFRIHYFRRLNIRYQTKLNRIMRLNVVKLIKVDEQNTICQTALIRAPFSTSRDHAFYHVIIM